MELRVIKLEEFVVKIDLNLLHEQDLKENGTSAAC